MSSMVEGFKKEGRTLGVNIDHVATLRQARGTDYPSVLLAAHEAIKGGADQITVHLREDRRHIQDRDIYELREEISVPLNLEMAASDEIVNIALDVCPHTITLVPERRKELTTEGGLDCISNRKRLSEVIKRLQGGGIDVSLFIDPLKEQVEMARELATKAIEFHTGRYCGYYNDRTLSERELDKLREVTLLANGLGLRPCAGHGLNYDNIKRLVNHIPEIVEYNIGHAIVARAMSTGLRAAVSEMRRFINVEENQR